MPRTKADRRLRLEYLEREVRSRRITRAEALDHIREHYQRRGLAVPSSVAAVFDRGTEDNRTTERR